jgi:SH3-like domain-containing protein
MDGAMACRPRPVPFPPLSRPARVPVRPIVATAALLAMIGPAAAQTGSAHHLPAHPHATTHGVPAHHPAAHPAPHGPAHPAARPGPHGHPEPARHAAHPAARRAAKGAAVGVAAGAAAAAAAAAAAPAASAPPPPPAPPNKGTSTGFPLPRFAALRADEVNLRNGPGTRYPIQWVYKRRDLPVKVEREFDVWRLIEDMDGVKGWVNQATLVGTRTFLVLAPAGTAPAAEASTDAAGADGRILRASPASDAAAVAILKPGVIGRLRSCQPGSNWCKVSVKSVSGWLQRDAMWGLLPDEAIQP